MKSIGVIKKYTKNKEYSINSFLQEKLNIQTIEDFRNEIDLNDLEKFDNLLNTNVDHYININIGYKSVLISKFIQESDDLEYILHVYIDISKEGDYKTSVLSNTTHEIITPLNCILGMLSILEDTNLNTDQQDYLEMIKECSYNLLSIVNDILDYSKLEIKKIKLNNTPFDLRKCIESINDIVLSKVNEKKLEYNSIFDQNLHVNFIGDQNRLKQVLLNLLYNSIKFTDKGSITLHVSAINYNEFNNFTKKNTSFNAKNQYLRFDIIDEGCGINKIHEYDIFNSFVQVSTDSTKIYQGSGLGLSICKKLIGLFEGKIWLDWSEINKGSKFSFVIELEIDNITPIHEIEDTLNILENKRVILIDDNMYNRISLTALLIKWNMDVVNFSNAEEALQFLKMQKRPFDIGLIDFCMPKIDGIMFAEKLRNTTSINCNLPLIALSSMNDKIHNKSSIFVEYLLKPVKESKLKQLCIDIFNKSKDTIIKQPSIINHIFAKKTIRILIAEDIFINQKIIVNYLNKLGYVNLKVVNNGEKCINELTLKEYDILLIDIKMPVLNGVEVCTIIQNNFLGSDNTYKFINKRKPYLIAVTAYCLKEDTDYYFKKGFDEIINKPIQLEELNTVLELYLLKEMS
jgi:signal transduction histidine kinase/DNA-binding response OmpR family regulator